MSLQTKLSCPGSSGRPKACWACWASGGALPEAAGRVAVGWPPRLPYPRVSRAPAGRLRLQVAAELQEQEKSKPKARCFSAFACSAHCPKQVYFSTPDASGKWKGTPSLYGRSRQCAHFIIYWNGQKFIWVLQALMELFDQPNTIPPDAYICCLHLPRFLWYSIFSMSTSCVTNPILVVNK